MSLPRIAVDAMGGDDGVRVMVEGAALARRRYDRFKFLLVGDETRIKAALDDHPNLRSASEVLHAEDTIGGEEKPSQALRRAKTTSMGLAVEAVKSGKAGAAVSGGNTGALMAIAKIALRTLPGIDRPALAALLPTLGENDLVMLDLGANTECDARNLVEFAVMGAAYSRVVTGRTAPRVRLLNIGTEEIKGTDSLQEAAAVLRRAEGTWRCRSMAMPKPTSLAAALFDVVVSDGFSGNIALEGSRGHGQVRRRPAQAQFHQFAALEVRFPDLAPGDRPAAPPSRSQQSQRRGIPWPQRHRREKPRRRQCGWRCQCRGCCRAPAGRKRHRTHQDRPRGDRHGRTAPRRRATGSAPDAAFGPDRHGLGTCPDARSPTRNWPRPSTPATNGSSSAPAFATAISPATDETTSSLATEAARKAIAAAGIEACSIDLIILATATPDQTFPASATLVQDALGCNGCVAFDVACGLLGLSLCRGRRRCDDPRGQRKARAGDRRGNVHAHSRLGRPDDLRAVR